MDAGAPVSARSARGVTVRGGLAPDDPDAFVDGPVALPAVGPRDLVVRVRAVSVNPVDVKARRRMTDAAPRLLGWDAAGEVLETGADCVLFRPGDRVYYAGDFNRPGTQAQLHVVDERLAGRLPATLDFAEAAALPLTALTAWEALFEQLHIQHGDSEGHLLVVGGAGGVGSMAIQLARLAGLEVTATASRPESMSWVRALGARHVLDHRAPLAPQLREAGLPAPRWILCCAETDPWFDALVRLVAPRGRIALLASTRQPHALQPLMDKAASVVWENVFAKSHYGIDLESQHRILEMVADHLDDGRLRTTLRELAGPLDAAHLRAAHARVESGQMIGKLVLTL